MSDHWHPYIPLPYDPEYEPDDCNPGPNWRALGLWAFVMALVGGLGAAALWLLGVV